MSKITGAVVGFILGFFITISACGASPSDGDFEIAALFGVVVGGIFAILGALLGKENT